MSARDLNDNGILARLTREERARLEPHLGEASHARGVRLSEGGQSDHTLHLPCTGILSLMLTMEDGATGELAVVGSEGVVGMSIFLSGRIATGEAVVQVSCDVFTLPAPIVREEFDRNGNFQKTLLAFSQAVFAQIAQTALCNRHHSIEQQLARWLLMSMDRMQGPDFSMTQELIAGMLGVRREGVTVAAGKLRDLGAITYRRGHVKILDREALEEKSCECYRAVTDQYRLLGFTSD